MKKVILFFAVAISSVLIMAQTNQITWVNGRAVLGQSISSIDSIKYGTIVDADQLVLWLPKTIIVHDTVIVHDTIIINKCDSSHAPEGVEMVDLGLPSGIKWANMNVGATKPEESGDYFAWGETTPKLDYYWSTYKYMESGKCSWEYITKYTQPDKQWEGYWYTDNGTYIGDNKTTLEPEDDAAHVNWGSAWRMPTQTEIDELMNNCTWTWTRNYNDTGAKGYIVSSKTNDNSIFLPAAGNRRNTSLNDGSLGCYWSSSLMYYSFSAYSLRFSSSGLTSWDNYTTYYNDRCYGQSIRPVCE